MSAEPSVITALLKMLGALALVLAGLWALYALVRRLNAGGRARAESLIRVLDTKGLGMKKQVAVIEVMGDFFLVGISGDALTVLSRIRAGRPRRNIEDAAGASEQKGFGACLGMPSGTSGEKERP